MTPSLEQWQGRKSANTERIENMSDLCSLNPFWAGDDVLTSDSLVTNVGLFTTGITVSFFQ